MRPLLIGLVLGACGCGSAGSDDTDAAAAPVLFGLSPSVGSALGGEPVVVEGEDLDGDALTVELSIFRLPHEVLEDGTLAITTPRLTAGLHDLRLLAGETVLDEIPEAWLAEPVELAFAPAPPGYLPATPAAVRMAWSGRLDEDGVVDLLVRSDEGVVHLWSGAGGGTFTDEGPFLEADLAALGLLDLDRDREVEALVCDAATGLLAVWGRGPDSADWSVVEGAAPELACADLVVGGTGVAVRGPDGEVHLLRAAPDASSAALERLQDEPLTAVGASDRLALADVGDDGWPDLLVIPASGAAPSWWRGGPDGARPGAPSSLPAEAGCRAGAPVWEDLDGDDDLDLFIPCRDGQDRLLRGDGSGRWFDDTTAALPVDHADGLHATAADLDLDGASELLIATWDGVDRLYGSLDGRWIDRSARLDLDAGRTRVLLPLDADGDGDLDLLQAGPDGARLWVAVPGEAR